MNQSTDDKRQGGRAAHAAGSFDPNGVIGRKLKSFYNDIETESVPGRLLDLLEQLDEAERKAKAGR
jgi:hypothetical protein